MLKSIVLWTVSIITLKRLNTVVLVNISPGKWILNAILSEQQEKASSNGEKGYAVELVLLALNKVAAPVMQEQT